MVRDLTEWGLCDFDDRSTPVSGRHGRRPRHLQRAKTGLPRCKKNRKTFACDKQLSTTSKSDELPFTNYTIFRDVDYDKGQVVTGWNYDLVDTVRPKSQMCYYKQNIEKGITAKVMLAINNSPRRPSALTKVSFNFDGALANCIWFSGY
jgi:hypothetical protein